MSAEYTQRATAAPFPTDPPFLSIYTSTYRRPASLMQCLESVRTQTANADLEHLIVPDHVGYGVVDGLFRRIAWYASAMRGRYVHVLCDDDILAAPDVVARVRAFAEAEQYPPVIVVRCVKGLITFPQQASDMEPIKFAVDMSCYILRRDVWIQHAADYGSDWCGDFDHVEALWKAGHRFAVCDVLFVKGGRSGGAIEATGTSGLRTVLPAEAQAWLATSPQGLKAHKVAAYASRMRGGKWAADYDGQRPVRIQHGKLRNGNHRMAAIIAANLPVTLLVRED